MKWMQVLIFPMLILGLCVVAGCEDDDDDGGSSGSFAGTWTGNVCGRGLTLTLTQDGTTLSGNYTLSDPTFSEAVTGAVGSTTPPASATLNGGGGRSFQITFDSYTGMSGGYYKNGTKVCDVTANK